MVEQNDGGGRQEPARRISIRHLLTLFAWTAALALFFYFFKSFRVLFLGVLAAGCLAAALYPLKRLVPASRALPAIVVGVAPILLTVGLIAVT